MSSTTLEKSSSSVSAETATDDGSDTLFDKKLHEVGLAYIREQAALAENGSTITDNNIDNNDKENEEDEVVDTVVNTVQEEEDDEDDPVAELHRLEAQRAFDAIHTLDVVGVSVNLNGRSCSAHACCGEHVVAKSKLLLEWGVQPVYRSSRNKASIEEVVKAWLIGMDGTPTCHVGYLSVATLSTYEPTRFDGLFLRVTRDLRNSLSNHERHRSHFYSGILECEVIKNNPRYTGTRPFDNEPCDVSYEGKKGKKKRQQMVVGLQRPLRLS